MAVEIQIQVTIEGMDPIVLTERQAIELRDTLNRLLPRSAIRLADPRAPWGKLDILRKNRPETLTVGMILDTPPYGQPPFPGQAPGTFCDGNNIKDAVVRNAESHGH